MNLSSFTALSQCVGCVLISLFFFFFPLVLSGHVGLFLAALVVQDLLPAFSWYSVRIVVDVSFSPLCSACRILVPHPLWWKHRVLTAGPQGKSL